MMVPVADQAFSPKSFNWGPRAATQVESLAAGYGSGGGRLGAQVLQVRECHLVPTVEAAEIVRTHVVDEGASLVVWRAAVGSSRAASEDCMVLLKCL